MKYRVISFLLKILIVIISRTVRLKVYNRELIDRIKGDGKQIIFVFYHQELFLLIHYINHYRYNKVTVLASPSRDGDIAEAVLRRFNFDVVRGSSRRGGLRGMIESIMALKNGSDVAFAIDGPLGPPRQTKPGIFLISQRTGALIVPVSTWAVPNFKLSTWDRTMIPLPFSRGSIVFGEPLEWKNFEEEDIEALNQRFQKVLDDVSARARELCG